MQASERYVYHIVTRKKMALNQIINFDNQQKNTLYRFFFEQELLNSKGEDVIQILHGNYTDDGLLIRSEEL